jgi:hypothetical protein
MPEAAAVGGAMLRALGRHAIATCPHSARQPDEAHPWRFPGVPERCSACQALAAALGLDEGSATP